MRVLVATDAWHPQVNGVVRTYERLAIEAGKLRLRDCLPHAVRLPHASLPNLSGDSPGARRSSRHRRVCRQGETRLHPHRHRGADRPGCAAHLPGRKLPVHHQLSHPLSGICLGPPAAAAGRRATPTCGGSTSRRRRLMVATPTMRDELHGHGFRNIWPGRAASTPSCSGRAAGATSSSLPARSSSMSAASRWRRTSRPSSTSTCRAPRWWSAAGRSRGAGAASTRRWCSPAPKSGEELARALSPAPTSSCFPCLTDTFGLVILEAMASGVRWRPIRRPGPRTCSPSPESGAMDWDLKAAMAESARRSTATPRERMRFAIAGRIRRGSSSTTCSSPITASCQSGGGAGAAIGKRKRPGWGGTGPFHSHASVWGTLGGYRVLPEMVSDPLNVKNPPAKSCAERAKSRNKICEKNFEVNGGLWGFWA